jgi:CMP-N,N'-diacetyllegionaminic acid synthase
MKILVTICARGGSKGLPSKNSRPLLGKPLIAHTIDQAKAWGKADRILVSTDSEEIRRVAREFGAETPFLRPSDLATDSAGKLPVISHALREAEKVFGQRFDVVVDLDPTSPLRRTEDIEAGLRTFLEKKKPVCFSVVKGRKSPYFNMVERDAETGAVRLVKPLGQAFATRQSAPQVYDMNASIYVYSRDFLMSEPTSVWSAPGEMFEMPPESAFDIDFERDFVVTEALMKHRLGGTA